MFKRNTHILRYTGNIPGNQFGQLSDGIHRNPGLTGYVRRIKLFGVRFEIVKTDRVLPDKFSVVFTILDQMIDQPPDQGTIGTGDDPDHQIMDRFRPGHADYSYQQKYGIRDYRGGGRSSARETAMRVAAGGIAKKYLKQRYGIEIRGYLAQLGPIRPQAHDWSEVHNNPFFSADAACVAELESYMDALRKSGDSIGARINVVASGMMPGLGEPVFDRLDAEIAQAMMSINAVKGVEIGAGFACVEQKGTEHRDEMTPEGFLSNHAGGILGGISSGQDVVVSIALKPTSSLRLPGKTVDLDGNPVEVVTTGRHDPCVGIRATPIAEAMLAIVLMDHVLRHRAQNMDVESGVPVIPAQTD